MRWLLALVAVAPLLAHVGSPDVFQEGPAGPYRVLVVIRPPLVIPGLAEIEVRTADKDVRGIRVTPLALTGAIGAYLGLWLFLSGGIIDRYARGRPVSTSMFFATCGVFFFRFLRMAALTVAAYWAIFHWVRPWLLGTVFDWGSHALATEHQGLVLRGWLYGGLLAVVALVNLVVDIAKVRAVVEDRHSAIASLFAGARFVRRRAWRCAGLYLLNVLSAAVLARLWLQVAPSASAPDWQALLIGQIYLIGRIWARLSFIASEVVFFQGELAHASYAGAPVLRSSKSHARG